MPLYEYSCSACGAVSEINHRMSDPTPTHCPVCGKDGLSKLISAAGFRLKGEGWYETDFKSGNKKNLVGDAGSGTGSGAAKPAAEAKSETKAAAPSAPSTPSATP